MRSEIVKCPLLVIVSSAFLGLAPACVDASAQQEPSNPIVKDQPEAQALYKRMIESIRKGERLSYESNLRQEVDGDRRDHRTYRVCVKKPNFFGVETMTKDGTKHVILVGDGRHAWSYSPNGRPRFSGEDQGTY